MRDFMRKKKGVHSSMSFQESLAKTILLMIDVDDKYKLENSCESENEVDDTPNYYRSLLEVSSRQQYRRATKIISPIEEEAELNKVTVNELLGVIIKQINYVKEREAAKVGDLLLNSQAIEKLSDEKSSLLQLNLNLGRFSYQTLKSI